MSSTTTKGGIAAALLEVQKNAPKIVKDSENPHFNNKFASLKAVLDAMRPVLNEAGVVVSQFPGYDAEGRPTLTTKLIHAESGESVDATMLLLLQKQDPQGQGSAMTYARRYALKAMLGLDDEDDDGNAGSKPGGQQARASTQPRQIQKWQAETLAAIYAKQPGSFEAAINKLYPADDPELTIPERVLSLNEEQADQLFKAVQP